MERMLVVALVMAAGAVGMAAFAAGFIMGVILCIAC